MSSGHGNCLFFGVNDGYLDGFLRGFRLKILDQNDYTNLGQCDNLDDFKLQLAQTDYKDFLANEPSPLSTNVIKEKCVEKLVNEFNYLRINSAQPLAQFLDYITYGYMIDNIILLLTGTLHEREMSELLAHCHPLGTFKAMETLGTCHNMSELYHTVLIDTPLGPYIANNLSEEDFDSDANNIEVVRNTLYKAYLKDFYQFCCTVGDDTALTMKDILEFEADRRAITITLNSFDTSLTKDDRAKLYPDFGKLAPEGLEKLSRAEDFDQVKDACNYVNEYRRLFADVGPHSEKTIEDAFFEYEVEINRLAFEYQAGYGAFYCYFRLKEQEIRNIIWIAECITQGQKGKLSQGIINIM